MKSMFERNAQRGKELDAFIGAWLRPMEVAGVRVFENRFLRSVLFSYAAQWLNISVHWGKFRGIYGAADDSSVVHVIGETLDDVLRELQQKACHETQICIQSQD